MKQKTEKSITRHYSNLIELLGNHNIKNSILVTQLAKYVAEETSAAWINGLFGHNKQECQREYDVKPYIGVDNSLNNADYDEEDNNLQC